MKHIIKALEENCILEQMGVEPGDALLEINGKKIEDIFDYRFFATDEYTEVLIRKKDGDEWLLEIEKDEYEDLGAEFATPLMSEAKSCKNKCIFCFIDQLPPEMRKSLYFKDDDPRLSFLEGNYVTLTNVTQKELERLIYYRLSPVNVSVHTTDADLRVKMMGNKNACKIKEQLERLSGAGIELNCQLVLVKGVNDGEQLKKSIRDLMGVDGVKSVSAVPVGLTEYRENLPRLSTFTKEDAIEVLKIIHAEQLTAINKKGRRFIYAGDEFYLKAGAPFPEYDEYDGFPQLENGVGMLTLFEQEFNIHLNALNGDDKYRSKTVITGKLTESFIKKLVKKTAEKFTKMEIKVIMVENSFFGADITVSGLLTGGIIIEVLKKKNVKGRVLLPSNCFRADEDIFLDDISLDELNARAGVSAVKVSCSGDAFLDALLEE